jgi:hypothetical protein
VFAARLSNATHRREDFAAEGLTSDVTLETSLSPTPRLRDSRSGRDEALDAAWDLRGSDVAGEPAEAAAEVEAAPLDADCEHRTPPALGKIDLEGAKVDVFAGRRQLPDTVRPVLVEMRDEAGWAACRSPRDFGYRLDRPDAYSMSDRSDALYQPVACPA